MIQKVIIIGCGNVGYHLGKRFHEVGVEVIQVFSRKLEKAKQLGQTIGAAYTDSLAHIRTDADLYILAVWDSAVERVQTQLAEQLPETALVVHTSGACPQTAFTAFPNHGVFYPLQTFSIARAANFEIIPLCVDATQARHTEALEALARRIAPNVYRITDTQRAKLHVAAVFVNNFSNHMAAIAHDITEREGLSFDLLRPLMLETALKIQAHEPRKVQTGPAVRKDESTIQRHLDYLEFDPRVQEIYTLLTESIKKEKLQTPI